MTNICFNLNNTISIKNNRYIFNNIENDVSYGLFTTDNDNNYLISNVPKSHPIGFFLDNQSINIKNLITYKAIYNYPIKIYVSKGSDLSFSNNDYYRFYDESYNLINIAHSSNKLTLTNNIDNFYFMKSITYNFIAIQDFNDNHPFYLRSDDLNDFDSSDYSLNNINKSFNITIPENADNNNNRIYYYDGEQHDISVCLIILVDNNKISYFYGNVEL